MRDPLAPDVSDAERGGATGDGSPAATGPHARPSDSPEGTRALAAALGRLVAPGDAVLLVGPLGAGKTCFAQGLARGLGITAQVRSPTFVLLARYPGQVPLVHLDLYRIDGEAAFDELGLEEHRAGAVLVAEWGEKLIDRFEDALVVTIEEVDPERRRLVARGTGERSRRLAEAWLGDGV